MILRRWLQALKINSKGDRRAIPAAVPEIKKGGKFYEKQITLRPVSSGICRQKLQTKNHPHRSGGWFWSAVYLCGIRHPAWMGDTSRKTFSRLSRPFTKGIPDNVKAESKAPFLKNSTFGPAKKTFYILCCEGLRKDAGERNGQDLRGGILNHIGKSLCRNAQAFFAQTGRGCPFLL